METMEPVELLHPGAFIEEELEERGWSQQDLADILKRPARLVSELVNGKRAITVETARGLARAFDTSVELWLNLQRDYEVARSRPREPEEKAEEIAVARRARLFGLLPIRDMTRRGWIAEAKDVAALEAEVCKFANCNDLAELEGCLPHAARKSGDASLSPLQRAWLLRARQLANVPVACKFTTKAFPSIYEQLKPLLSAAPEVRHVPRVLSQFGIRMVVVEPIPGAKMDGACFWLDARSPVIVLSLRFDRLDSFWFTLRHELDHVEHGEGKEGYIVDEDTGPGSKDQEHRDSPEEQRANRNAGAFLVPPAELDGFIARVQPYFSEERVVGFARRIGVHPGLIVGQLHNRGVLPPSHLRKSLEKVRSVIAGAAVCDGWGVSPQISG
ncbi:HigA family addiction module antitoxin [Humitalea sp. 24SJ18S-53]|uniref:HigA family addiction module antitoxin n=1 Tax=Humitalea sp. 24SJ18S-53 TaxID=3422307 RepID=UPI003D665DB0